MMTLQKIVPRTAILYKFICLPILILLLTGFVLDHQSSWSLRTGIGTSAASSSSSLLNSRTQNYHHTLSSNNNNHGGNGGFWEQPFAKPYFENSTKRDVTTTVGQTAYLNCRVRNLGDRAVSWIRKRDLHILTVGVLTYTGDQRFQSLHSDGSDEWTLKISSTQMRDSATYECQVSTEPKISMAFHLSVVVSQAEILGNSELHLKSGSDINLTCIVRQIPEPPTYIYWYHGSRVINYSQRGGINVVTEKQTRTSRLLISKAQPNDSGNYTCSPSNSESASALVYILNGEHPAAMQHGNSHGVPSKQIFINNPMSPTNNIHLNQILIGCLILTLHYFLIVLTILRPNLNINNINNYTKCHSVRRR